MMLLTLFSLYPILILTTAQQPKRPCDTQCRPDSICYEGFCQRPPFTPGVDNAAPTWTPPPLPATTNPYDVSAAKAAPKCMLPCPPDSICSSGLCKKVSRQARVPNANPSSFKSRRDNNQNPAPTTPLLTVPEAEEDARPDKRDGVGRPCGARIATCDPEDLCVPNEPSCTRGENCIGTCQPKRKYADCGGRRVRPKDCQQGEICVDDPYVPGCGNDVR